MPKCAALCIVLGELLQIHPVIRKTVFGPIEGSCAAKYPAQAGLNSPNNVPTAKERMKQLTELINEQKTWNMLFMNEENSADSFPIGKAFLRMAATATLLRELLFASLEKTAFNKQDSKHCMSYWLLCLCLPVDPSALFFDVLKSQSDPWELLGEIFRSMCDARFFLNIGGSLKIEANPISFPPLMFPLAMRTLAGPNFVMELPKKPKEMTCEQFTSTVDMASPTFEMAVLRLASRADLSATELQHFYEKPLCSNQDPIVPKAFVIKSDGRPKAPKTQRINVETLCDSYRMFLLQPNSEQGPDVVRKRYAFPYIMRDENYPLGMSREAVEEYEKSSMASQIREELTYPQLFILRKQIAEEEDFLLTKAKLKTIPSYRIKSFLLHSGATIRGGHWQTYILVPSNGEWRCLRYDDSKESQVPLSEFIEKLFGNYESFFNPGCICYEVVEPDQDDLVKSFQQTWDEEVLRKQQLH
jgi:hypothetical protein